MILIDMNQISISSVIVEITRSKDVPNVDLVRHLILNSLRYFRNKFKNDYGELVLCYDSANPFRKDIFSQYKHNRKKIKEKSDVDWTKLFDAIGIVRKELEEIFPYKVMSCYKCEGDDIIATLTKKFNSQEKILIISGDKDFQQLQKYPNVVQYSPVQKTYLHCEDPKKFLFEHIVRGDSSDGVPNIMSDDDTFTQSGKRQKTIFQKNIDLWYLDEKKEFLSTDYLKRNFCRNKSLIDFNSIPQEYEIKILEEYEKPIKGSRSYILNYMIQKNLNNLIEVVSDF